MTEGDGLSRLVADIQCLGVGNQTTYVPANTMPVATAKCREGIDPTRKQKPLHDLSGQRSARGPLQL